MEGVYNYIDYVIDEFNMKVFPVVNGFNVHHKSSSRIIFFSYNKKCGLTGLLLKYGEDIFSKEITNFLKLNRGEFILLMVKWSKWKYSNV